MKVAIVTDDGTTVSQHFGMARYYAVLTVKGQQVVGREVLDRSDTLPAVGGHEPHQGLSGQIDCHGTGIAAAATHLRMVQPIRDCQVLLARGMSWSARECLLDAGIRPIVTDIVGFLSGARRHSTGWLILTRRSKVSRSPS